MTHFFLSHILQSAPAIRESLPLKRAGREAGGVRDAGRSARLREPSKSPLVELESDLHDLAGYVGEFLALYGVRGEHVRRTVVEDDLDDLLARGSPLQVAPHGHGGPAQHPEEDQTPHSLFTASSPLPGPFRPRRGRFSC